MSRFTTWRRIFAVAAVLLLAGAGAAVAQEQTGNLFGTVTDTQGDALPGVRVEVTGIGAPRTQFTNAQGQFRLLNLDPGNYELTASLEGFSTVEYPAVNIRVGRSTTLEVTLSPAVEEVITVTSESPLLDERKVDRGVSVTQIELEKIPTARDPWAIITQTPGVLTDRINVGGNESGQQSVFMGAGVSDDENSFAVDGVLITDMAAIGASPTYYDFDQFEEMQVSTGGTDIEKVSSGASLNLVTKRGSNNPRGSARFLLTEDEQQFAIFEAADIDTGAELENGDGNGGRVAQTDAQFAGSSVEEVLDFGFEAGGPIVRDKLWVWGSYGRNDITQLAALTGIEDRTILENTAIKFNGQPVSANSIVGSWNRGDKIKLGRLGTPNRALDASWDQDGPSEIWKIEDTHVFSSDFYLTGLYSYVDGGFQLQSKGGSFPSPVTTTDASVALANGETFLDANNIWQNGWYSGKSNRDLDNFQVDGSYFFNTGNLNHELKFGVSRRDFETQSNFGWAGGRNSANGACENFGLCPFDILLASRSGETRVEQDYTAGWLQDTLTSGNWTVNAGIRYDLQDGENIGSTAEANPLFPDALPALVFNGNQGGCVDDNCQFGGDFEWESISPRVGVTYALGAERKTLLRANFSRFAEQLSSGNFFGTNPIGINTVTFIFEDVNNNNVFDVGETLIGPFGTPPGNFAEVDAGLDPSITDEFAVGVEHAFLPEFVVGLDVTWRNTSDILESRAFAFDANGNKVIVTRADYVPDTDICGSRPGIPDNCGGFVSSDGVNIPHLPDGTPWSTQFWRLRDGLSFAGGGFTTNGDREVDYLGASLTFTKRLSNRWMARGFVQYADQEWNVPASFSRFDDPTNSESGADDDGGLFTVQSAGSGPFGDVLIQSSWSFNLNGMYQVAPDRPWGFNVAGNLFGREGYPLPYNYGFPSSLTGDGVGRTAGVTTDVDRFRADDPVVLDLRIEKDMQFTDNLSGILSIDAFNVTNEQYVMQRDRELDLSTANHLTQNLAPRIYRLGFRLNWR